MKFRTTLMAATVIAAPALLLPPAAQAQPVTGPYVSADVGLNIRNSRDINSITVFPPAGFNQPPQTLSLGDTKLVYHNGYAIDAAIGYGFGNGLRVELEGDYANNAISKIDLSVPQSQLPPVQVVASGNGLRYGVMANALYDFDVGLPYLYPFVGGGIGYQFLQASDVGPGFGFPGVSNTQGSFAYQGIVGVSFPISGLPGLSATVKYRYMATTGNENYKFAVPTEGGAVTGHFNAGNDSSNVITLGLRYQLFPPAPPPPAPAPAPVAAPAPAPARTYLVFFDWDKANVTPRATDIIADAANASHSTTVTQLKVNGYTDTSGPAGYNRKLSLRRANNVAALLVADGVPKQEIVIKGFGETHLLVPTGPNVREPQNRRVEIILH